jgi:hypothetical protein
MKKELSRMEDVKKKQEKSKKIQMKKNKKKVKNQI